MQGSVRGLVCGLKGGFHGGSLGLCWVVAGSLNGFIGLPMFFYKVLVRLLSGFVRFHGAPAGFYTSLRFRVKIVQGFGLG